MWIKNTRMLNGRPAAAFSCKLILAFFCSVCGVQAQTKRLIAEIDTLNLRAGRLYHKPDSMAALARQAYDLSRRISYGRGEALSLKYLATFAHMRSNFDSALTLHGKSLSLFRKLGDSTEATRVMLSLATVYNNINDHVNSIAFGMEALRGFERTGDRKGIGKVLNTLGVSWASQGEFRQAKKYFLQYHELARQGTDTVDIGYSFNNLGGVYRDLGDPDSALYYFNIAAGLFTKVDYPPGMALACKNIGAISYDKGAYGNALYYAQKGLEINRRTGETRAQAHSCHDIGTTYLKLGDIRKAEQYFQQALQLAAAAGDREILRNANHELSGINERHGLFRLALEQYKAAKMYNDSMFSIEKAQMYGDLERKYQTEQKEQQIRVLNSEAAVRRLQLRQRNILLAVSVVLLSSVALFVYFIQSRRKLRSEARLQHELHLQQQQAARDVLDAEERERRRIAADLHDGVGQILSAALFSLHQVQEHTEESSAARQMTERAAALLSQGCAEMRSISHQMMPSALLKTGLALSVKEFLEQIDGSRIRIYLDVAGLEERLDEQTETILYRVIQEAVSNVIRHAGASELSIQIVKDEQGISLTVEDNGKGFDPAALRDAEGIGLKNIRSRIALLNGTVEVDTAPDRGTLLVIYIPA